MSRPMAGSVQNMLERMSNADKDFRFMATNDLMAELQHENIRWDDECELKITKKIVHLLQDKNCEVQNLAVKCLKFLIGKIKPERIEVIIKDMCDMLSSESDQIRGISTVALKTIISEIPINENMINIINRDLNPKLLKTIADSTDFNIRLESLDILTDLINLNSSQLSEYHQVIQNLLFRLLGTDRSALRKRSINAISQLMICCNDEVYHESIKFIVDNLENSSPKSQQNAREFLDANSTRSLNSKTFLQCLACVIRAAGHRSNADQVNRAMTLIRIFCQIEDDELREYCLQVYESFARRCPVNISPHLPALIKVCLNNISHDPNYNYDEEENEDEDMEMDGPEDDASESSQDFSDDDDISWKVRRASAKCLEIIIISRPDMINDFFVIIAPSLIARFKEREESVKADIIQTFISLLKQALPLINVVNEEPAIVRLKELIPTIINKSANLLREKGVKTRQSIFKLFTEIMNVIPNAYASNIASLVPGILYSLADKNSTSSMKISALVFVKDLLRTHEPSIFYPHIHVILPAINNAVKDSFYKIASEALVLLTQIVRILRPFDNSNFEPLEQSGPIVESIYEKTIECFDRSDIDSEIKEKAITCMGQIIATFGDHLLNRFPSALPSLLEKLNNETTRLTAVKSLIMIAASPIPIDISNIFPKAYTTLATFLRQNSRPLRISTLILIESSVQRSPNLIDEAYIQSILIETPCLISESDLYLSQLTLNMIATLIRTHKAFLPVLPQSILPGALKLIRSPLLQGSPLNSMLQFLSTLVKHNFPGIEHKLIFQKLLEPIYKEMNVHKQAYSSTAKAVAAISILEPSCAFMTVSQLVNDINQYQDNDSIQTLILLSIGEIGKNVDLAQVNGLVEVIFQAFTSTSEEVKSAGSYALGSVAIGNLGKFLPFILQEIETRNKRQYLLLHSLREVISSGLVDNHVISEHLESIWALLMKHCECYEEGTRNVVSECLGKLTLLRPTFLLERLLNSLKGEFARKPTARSTLITAIKFTISDQPQEIDVLLKSCIGEFLTALQDDDINVRRVALITLNSAAHNKPSLIRDLLPKILPLLYRETQVKSHLIREVQMGPFKHSIDDGLDSRKAAFECMYTLLDSCQGQLDIFEFLSHVESGLKDHYDIKMLTYLMLSRLSTVFPSAVLQRIDRLMAPIEEVVRTKPKETAVKQEHERLDELKRSALKAFEALSTIPDAMRHPVILRFKHYVA